MLTPCCGVHCVVSVTVLAALSLHRVMAEGALCCQDAFSLFGLGPGDQLSSSVLSRAANLCGREMEESEAAELLVALNTARGSQPDVIDSAMSWVDLCCLTAPPVLLHCSSSALSVHI